MEAKYSAAGFTSSSVSSFDIVIMMELAGSELVRVTDGAEDKQP